MTILDGWQLSVLSFFLRVKPLHGIIFLELQAKKPRGEKSDQPFNNVRTSVEPVPIVAPELLRLRKFINILDAARLRIGLTNSEFSKATKSTRSRWVDLKAGRRKLNLDELLVYADTMGLSLSLMAPHHEPFLNLTPGEAKIIRQFAAHYLALKKDRAPKGLRGALEKLIDQPLT